MLHVFLFHNSHSFKHPKSYTKDCLKMEENEWWLQTPHANWPPFLDTKTSIFKEQWDTPQKINMGPTDLPISPMGRRDLGSAERSACEPFYGSKKGGAGGVLGEEEESEVFLFHVTRGF